MDAVMILIWFIVGTVLGFVISRNFFIALIFGGIFSLISIGVVTVGFDIKPLIPKLW